MKALELGFVPFLSSQPQKAWFNQSNVISSETHPVLLYKLKPAEKFNRWTVNVSWIETAEISWKQENESSRSV